MHHRGLREGDMDGQGSATLSGAMGRERFLGLHPLVPAILLQVLVWSIGPALIFGNLHSDTLEAAYWGRDWALGYSKHPPVTTWLIDLALRTGLQPVFALMLLSQTAVAATSFFVWRTVRLLASRETAALAVLLYAASPAATVYAVQLNHNSMLAPFWAATVYFGLVYLEERRWRDAIFLGFFAGVGMLTKYEILFVLVSLLAAAAIVPRFRPAFFHPASYVAVLVFFVVIAPHIWWLDANRWPSMTRALGADKIESVNTLNASAVNMIVGLFTLFIVPCAMLLATARRRRADDLTDGPSRRIVASVLGFAPLAVLLIGAVVTMQVLKPLWVLPLSSSVAVALAVLFPAGEAGFGLRVPSTAKILAGVSTSVFLAFAAYLVIAGAIGKPLTAYAAGTKKLALATEALWREKNATPLECVVVADRKIGPSGVLWIKSRPDYVDFSSPGWQTPAQIGECRRSGAIAVLAEASDALDRFPAACRNDVRRFDMPPASWLGKAKFPVDLVYIPPEGTGSCERK